MLPRSTRVICFVALTFVASSTLSRELQARGGLGTFHAGGYQVAPMGAMAPDPSGTPGSYSPRPSYGAVHYHPSVGHYHPAPRPFTYSPYGGFHYNESYSNPYTYHNPYQYRQFSNPYSVPFTKPF